MLEVKKQPRLDIYLFSSKAVLFTISAVSERNKTRITNEVEYSSEN